MIKNEDELREEWYRVRQIQNKHMAAMHRELGRFFGYPKCCIEQFVRETLMGISSAVYREAVHGKPIVGVEYVPCDKCMEQM